MADSSVKVKKASHNAKPFNSTSLKYYCNLRFPRALGAAEEEFEGGFGFDALAVF